MGMGKNIICPNSDLGCFLGYSVRDHNNLNFFWNVNTSTTNEGVKYKPTGNFGLGTFKTVILQCY